MTIRIALPDLEDTNQIHAAGIALINVFALDLFDFIDRGLKKIKGVNWLTDMQVQNVGTDQNFKDPSALLKELVHKGGSPLRQPVSANIPQANWKDFYKRLEVLLGERHVWVHNSIKTDADQLKLLVVLINKISWALELPVTQECNALVELITPDEVEVAVEAPEPEEAVSDMVTELGKFTNDDEAAVGSPVEGPFISHSYTLHMNGSIRDRATGELLEDLIDAGGTLGALLIARKPSGGRMRITAKGEIAAYFTDTWGFLALVDPDNWFPEHLS